MQLIIDIGNTSVKYYYAGQEFSSLEKLPHVAIKSALIVSTVPSQNNTEQDNFIIWALKHGAHDPEINIYEPLKDSKLKKLYTGIGADRIAKLDAARAQDPNRDIILFDFGTATTMTVCNSQGEFIGGFIALGLNASLRALGNCSELPNLSSHCDDHSDEAIHLAKSTDEAILSGSILAHQALIDSWLKSARLVTSNALTIATGGQREFFADKFERVCSSAELFN